MIAEESLLVQLLQLIDTVPVAAPPTRRRGRRKGGTRCGLRRGSRATVHGTFWSEMSRSAVALLPSPVYGSSLGCREARRES